MPRKKYSQTIALECKAVETTVTTAQNTHNQVKVSRKKEIKAKGPKSLQGNFKFYSLNDRVQSYAALTIILMHAEAVSWCV